MSPKWVNKYERKPGRWVFEPSDEYRMIGEAIKIAVCKAWKAPSYYYHLRRGGHVEALKLHGMNKYFVRFDIEDFFGRINRTRVTRCLKEYFSFPEARKMANDSTVRHPVENDRWVLPYGFVQSPILASLALAKSRLGTELERLHDNKLVKVSVYVDDIIASCNDLVQLHQSRDDLCNSAQKAALEFGASKTQGPAPTIIAFNIELAHMSLAIVPQRLDEFAVALAESDSEQQREGILKYVESVNDSQAEHLATK